MIFSIFLFMESLNVGLSLAGMTSLMFFATASLLGFTSVIPTAVASPIDDVSTGGATTAITTSDDNTSLNVTTATNVELKEEPFAVGRYTPVIENVINETQEVQIALEGSTTITLPNSTETITTRDTGKGVITSLPGGGIIRAQIQMSAEEDESESVTVDLTQYHLDEIPTTAISLAYFSTNSTGMMAPLSNMIAVSLDEEQPNGDAISRFFEWDVRSRAPTTIGSINNTDIVG
jgi:hypothetical protein